MFRSSRDPRTPGQILSLTTHLNFYDSDLNNSNFVENNSLPFQNSLSSSTATTMATVLSEGAEVSFNQTLAASACLSKLF